VQWALEATGLPYRFHALDHTAGDLDTEAYGKISPPCSKHEGPASDDRSARTRENKGRRLACSSSRA
jgi:hypothetical protein